jgi:hypothetical protein
MPSLAGTNPNWANFSLAPNHRFEGTACKLRLQVPSALRAPAAPQAER